MNTEDSQTYYTFNNVADIVSILSTQINNYHKELMYSKKLIHAANNIIKYIQQSRTDIYGTSQIDLSQFNKYESIENAIISISHYDHHYSKKNLLTSILINSIIHKFLVIKPLSTTKEAVSNEIYQSDKSNKLY